MLPTQSFPASVRSSFFGLSAALGKFGALLGGFCFQPLAVAVGYKWLFTICGGISLLGVLLTHLAVQPYGRRTFVPESDVDAASSGGGSNTGSEDDEAELQDPTTVTYAHATTTLLAVE